MDDRNISQLQSGRWSYFHEINVGHSQASIRQRFIFVVYLMDKWMNMVYIYLT